MSFYRKSEIPEHLQTHFQPAELGLEKTPEAYVEKMVTIFREVRRVLKNDGTLWLNLGDSYAGSWGDSGNRPERSGVNQGQRDRSTNYLPREGHPTGNTPTTISALKQSSYNLKPKDLCMIPARVAIALQADGWYLRSDIIWHKPNPMPESVTDRPTKSHEYIFLMSKSAKYFYDAEAVKEPTTGNAHARGDGINPKARWKTPDGWDTTRGNGGHGSFHKDGREKGQAGYKHRPKQNESFSAAVKDLVSTRNKRTVWTVTTYQVKTEKSSHFATFPPALITPCIKAGSRKGDIVLDPFGGSMTTAYVSKELGRQSIMIELNEKYIHMGTKRLAQEVLAL